MIAVFSWLRTWRAEQLEGSLVAIFIASQAGEGMQQVEQVEAIADRGLLGDRYANGVGHWRSLDACQVTLVTEADLRKAEQRSCASFAQGQHRRNLVVRGIPLDAFRRRRVRIGETLLEFHRLRPPCGYLDRLVGIGTGKALGKGAGIGLKVIEGGTLCVGDRVSVIV
jgi:MOSC domain-containing protein YiiM